MLAFAKLVALSRVFIGAHYVGDVVNKALAAVVAAILVCVFYREQGILNRTLIRIF